MSESDSATDDLIRHALDDAAATLAAFLADDAHLRATGRAVELMAAALERGGRILACGNGGSLSDATHFAEELVGRFRETRPALDVVPLSDAATITCIANDFGFDQIFARQVAAHGRAGDVLLALSTSGASPNIREAVSTARQLGLVTVGLLGRGGGKVAAEVDVAIVVPHARTSDRIQEVHIQVIHAIVEALEAKLFAGDASGR